MTDAADPFDTEPSTRDPMTIFITGDVIRDWLEIPNPRSVGPQKDWRNYQLFPGFNWTCVWGGAALVERLLKSALGWSESDRRYEIQGVDDKLQKLSESERGGYLQSLAILRGNKIAGEWLVRVAEFKGFTAGPDGTHTNTVPTELPEPPPRIDCLIVDDAANGCRNDTGFCDHFRRLADPERTAYIIIKLSRPLQPSHLIKQIQKRPATIATGDGKPDSETPPKQRVIIVVNADDLRAQGMDISRRLSWERSAIDIVAACDTPGMLHDLCQLGDVLVRFANDGCAVLERNGTRTLVFDPRRGEDGFDQQLAGTMPGATSAFVASIAASIIIDAKAPFLKAPSLKAVAEALTASRRLLQRGFKNESTSDGRTCRVIDYPRCVFREEDAPVVKNEFADIALPRNDHDRFGWTILSTRINEVSINPKTKHRVDYLSIAKEIVRNGTDHLEKVPVVKVGQITLVDSREIEGFRSIENLMHEYILSRKGGKPRPLSIGIFGPPGSGKSFGIKQIADKIQEQIAEKPEKVKIEPVTFNLTQLEGPDDLIGAFHTARDQALKGNLPLLIFDEFDTAFDGKPWGWLKSFLAPMQDGEFKDSGQIHPLGHAIFAFTGGISHSFAAFTKPDHQQEFEHAKGPDFVSRLKGFLDVQGINPVPAKCGEEPYVTKGKLAVDSVCVIRRAVLLRSQLLTQEHRTRRMRPMLSGKEFLDIDEAVLEALLTATEYRHGARSLESILLMSRLTDRDHFGVASLPSHAQLSIHVDDSFVDILKRHAGHSGLSATHPTP
ncbi:MAG TPA: AAA family ATPase [Xanthobacteraceae bacterium]